MARQSKRYVIQNEESRAWAIKVIRELPLDPMYQVVIKKYQRDRSLAQNNLLHMWLKELTDAYFEAYGEQVAPPAWKIFFRALFLEEVALRGPGGELVTDIKHTSDLNVKEFSEFLERIEHYAAETYNIMLTRPEYLYYEALPEKKTRDAT